MAGSDCNMQLFVAEVGVLLSSECRRRPEGHSLYTHMVPSDCIPYSPYLPFTVSPSDHHIHLVDFKKPAFSDPERTLPPSLLPPSSTIGNSPKGPDEDLRPPKHPTTQISIGPFHQTLIQPLVRISKQSACLSLSPLPNPWSNLSYILDVWTQDFSSSIAHV